MSVTDALELSHSISIMQVYILLSNDRKVNHLNLQLAIAETCGPDGCQVKLLSDGRSLSATYLPRMKGRVFVHPGQLVAVDLSSGAPVIAWRWHRMKLVTVQPGGARLDDRGVNEVTGVIAPGLSLDLQPGQTVFVNGSQEGNCEIHGLLTGDARSGEQLSQPEQLEQVILPRIAAILANMPAA
jgi:hypothetical protein